MVRGRSTGVELSHNNKLPQVTLTLDGAVFEVVFCLFGLVLPVGNLTAHCLAWCCCFVLGMFRLFQIISPTIIKWRWASLGRAVLNIVQSISVVLTVVLPLIAQSVSIVLIAWYCGVTLTTESISVVLIACYSLHQHNADCYSQFTPST